jgi:hypothetical protein
MQHSRTYEPELYECLSCLISNNDNDDNTSQAQCIDFCMVSIMYGVLAVDREIRTK